MLDVIHLTKELIAIESTDPGTMEGGVAAYIRSYLSGCGAEITLQEVQPGRQNLMARLGGDLAGPALVLCCHMDTVVFGDGWTRDPLGAEEAEGRIYGRGSCDMKSGLACALSAFRKTALAVQAGAKLKRPLALLCTVDEEADMAGIGQAIEGGLVRRDDWVMDLEPTGGQIQMAHKGRLWLEIDVQGVTAHASRPEQGADAIAATGELIARARRDFLARAGDGDPVLGRATITFGQITGGYQPYVVPDRCRLWVDMRLAPPIDSGTAQAIFREAAAQAEAAVPGVNVSIEVTGDRPCIPLHRDAPLLRALQNACQAVTGKELEAGLFPGYTDTAVVAGTLGNVNCLSYGPGNLEQAHKPDEFVAIEDLLRCDAVLEALIQSEVLGQQGN